MYDMSLTGHDFEAVKLCVNMGIDSHLEAFTASSFQESVRGPISTLPDGRRVCLAIALDCQIAQHELPLLMRRLMEIQGRIAYDPEQENDPAENLARDILASLFGEDEELDGWELAYEYLYHPNRSNDAIGFRAQGLDERPTRYA